MPGARSRGIRPRLAPSGALLLGGTMLAIVAGVLAGLTLGARPAGAAGPPYPPPVAGQRVYDTAGVFDSGTIADAERKIQAIETRTGAQIVVYTQLKPQSDTPEKAAEAAAALGNQWGVGRNGFDDGLVILFDLDESLRHGQVQLSAGPGFAAAYLSTEDRQSIYENDMLPLLRHGDLGGAMLVALDRVDAAATPEHAAELDRARQVNAVIGIGGVAIAIVLILAWLLSWWRTGRDPYVADDASVLMAGPPRDLTPASAALLWDGRSTRHTLTTALLDLASRGELAFRQGADPEREAEELAKLEATIPGQGLAARWSRRTRGATIVQQAVSMQKRMGVELLTADPNDPTIVRNRVRPVGPAETYLLHALRGMASHGNPYLDPSELLPLGQRTGEFDSRLEQSAVTSGWFSRTPSGAINRWLVAGVAECAVGGIAAIAGLALPASGPLWGGAAVLVAGIATCIGAFAMPARTRDGALVRAMLAAYRRTLKLTLEQSRSMLQVVASRRLPWLETPDQAIVWGAALGLNHEVQRVLEQSFEDARAGTPLGTSTWLQLWYGGTAGSSAGSPGGWATAGMMSSSLAPDFGGMFSALGTIGSSPSSSSSGGGGFGGGGGFSGGGGAGGGF